MWPLAELDHGLVEVIFSANGSRTSLLSARVRRQAHYSSILPLQASGIICHNWVWHDHTTECIKILLAAQASSLAPACLQAAAVTDTSEPLTCCTKDTQCQRPKQVLLSPGPEPSSWQWVNNAELGQGRAGWHRCPSQGPWCTGSPGTVTSVSWDTAQPPGLTKCHLQAVSWG